MNRGERRLKVGTEESSEVLKGLTIGIVIAVVAMVVVILFLPQIREAIERAPPPSVSVTSNSIRTGNIGLDYVAWVDVSVHNYGGAGKSTIWVRVNQGDSGWTKPKTVNLDAKESEDLTFEFREVGFWTTNPTGIS